MPPSNVTCRRYGTFRITIAIVTRSLPTLAIGACAVGNERIIGASVSPGRLPVTPEMLKI